MSNIYYEVYYILLIKLITEKELNNDSTNFFGDFYNGIKVFKNEKAFISMNFFELGNWLGTVRKFYKETILTESL